MAARTCGECLAGKMLEKVARKHNIERLTSVTQRLQRAGDNEVAYPRALA